MAKGIMTALRDLLSKGKIVFDILKWLKEAIEVVKYLWDLFGKW